MRCVITVGKDENGKSGDILYGIFWCAIIGGLVGTRLLYYIVEIPEIIKDPSILWNFKNGYVVYGGIIGGILVSWLYCRIKKVSFIEYFDLVMPAVALAQGFGRIGCFLQAVVTEKQRTAGLELPLLIPTMLKMESS